MFSHKMIHYTLFNQIIWAYMKWFIEASQYEKIKEENPKAKMQELLNLLQTCISIELKISKFFSEFIPKDYELVREVTIAIRFARGIFEKWAPVANSRNATYISWHKIRENGRSGFDKRAVTFSRKVAWNSLYKCVAARTLRGTYTQVESFSNS